MSDGFGGLHSRFLKYYTSFARLRPKEKLLMLVLAALVMVNIPLASIAWIPVIGQVVMILAGVPLLALQVVVVLLAWNVLTKKGGR